PPNPPLTPVGELSTPSSTIASLCRRAALVPGNPNPGANPCALDGGRGVDANEDEEGAAKRGVAWNFCCCCCCCCWLLLAAVAAPLGWNCRGCPGVVVVSRDEGGCLLVRRNFRGSGVFVCPAA
ncbi:hypothetical protein VD0002_g9450, partial [Verticillium dahliae]